MDITLFIPILFFSAILFLFLFLVYKYIRLEIIDPAVLAFKIRGGLTPTQRNILEKNFPYYQALSETEKAEFEKRLKYFIYEKEFIGKAIPVTEEMKILVGASAVQLTFGYHPLKFPHFPQILLFPGRFYSKGSDRLKKGEVNSRGIIVFSWKDFIMDYKIKNDGINLGLHEMAHALKVEDISGDNEYAFIDESDLNYFYHVGKEEFLKMRKGEPSFIRSYGATDMEEFFAVSVEQFFEQPLEFEKQLPYLYNALVRVLRQNPAKRASVGLKI